MALRTRTPGARALLPVTRSRSSGPLEALLSSPALDVRLPTALQVLQVIGLILAPHLASRRFGSARLLRSTRGPVFWPSEAAAGHPAALLSANSRRGGRLGLNLVRVNEL